MRVTIAAVLCLALLPAAAEGTKTYRWTDEDGVVHFSDSPRPGATDPEADAIEIPDANVVRSRLPRVAPAALPSAAAASTDEDEAATSTGYRSVRIVSPADGDTLWNIGGRLDVSVQTEPRLRPNHSVVIIMDGKLATPNPVAGTTASLSEVWRGEHRISAIVRGADGQDLITSAPITIFVQQRSVN